MFSGKEKIIQISGEYALTNKGRLFYLQEAAKGQWLEVDLPELNSPLDKYKVPKGKTMFIEPVSNQEKWDDAKSLKDLI